VRQLDRQVLSQRTWPGQSPGIGFRQQTVESRDELRQSHAPLWGEDDAAVLLVSRGERHEVAYVEGEDASTLGRGAQELRLVICIRRHPRIGGPRSVMAPVYQGSM
jgi:hypothetical protein